uniref:Uncharacterized protein n=1 Tax=Coccolithus braarudii TaxID=221442 RepID=A0A7S0LSD4_9EUKA
MRVFLACSSWSFSSLILLLLVRRSNARRARPRAHILSTAATPRMQKVHHSSVALVPPDSCWAPIQAVRYELRDHGLYRWPPHINLLYPFVPPGEAMEEALARLGPAAAGVEPFELALDTLGTFGGRHHGVLWAGPSDTTQLALLVALQAALQTAMPEFDDQQRVGGGGFVPHMTLSHFSSLEEAEAARAKLAQSWRPVTFTVGCSALKGKASVHLMWRDGGAGQFKRAASLVLGVAPSSKLLEPPEPFMRMPELEEEWVKEARKAAKKPWKSAKSQRGRRSRSPRRTPEERAAIAARTPDEIETIRAERAARKRFTAGGEEAQPTNDSGNWVGKYS